MSLWRVAQPEDKSWRGEGLLVKGLGPATATLDVDPILPLT